jgi:peptidoglycan hydrolase-like protein with peptidoglycan-binding domain
MASDGAITMEIVTTDIVINPDLSDDGAFYAMFTGKGGVPDVNSGSLPGGENSAALIQVVQSNLAKLGFEPGPATGQLTDATRSAISQYQASRGMAVTGQPSSQLAAALQAEVNAL